MRHIGSAPCASRRRRMFAEGAVSWLPPSMQMRRPGTWQYSARLAGRNADEGHETPEETVDAARHWPGARRTELSALPSMDQAEGRLPGAAELHQSKVRHR